MIQKLASAIADIQGDLESYKTAEQEVRYLSSYLNEAQLNEKLANTNRLIQLVEQKIAADRQIIQKFMTGGFEGVVSGLAELPGLDRQLDNLKQLKHDYEKKLLALQTFSSTTSSLFTDSLQAFKYALQGVDLINQSTSSSDGTIMFPRDTNMEWLKKLEGEKFSSKLNEEDKVSLPKENKVKDSDDIVIETSSFTTEGITVSFSEVRNITTGETLKILGSSSVFYQFMEKFNGNKEIQEVPFGEPVKPGIDKISVGQSFFNALAQCSEIQETKKLETEKMKGSEYKEQELKDKKIAEDARKKSEIQRHIEAQQRMSSYNGRGG
ncbi:hypothetical protein RU86_GL001147 [Lactococcus piscium]|uniref:LXG domain-containing protein n=2 Tax=Pseudolactococcus piscium TaxID=1364 RepID=A0A2A5RVB8_9LACT|nr:hypothetical protein RU86_GL001147 [Lactococcus piscium]